LWAAAVGAAGREPDDAEPEPLTAEQAKGVAPIESVVLFGFHAPIEAGEAELGTWKR
jgi:hypothetical protein